MSTSATDIRALTDPAEVRAYFATFTEIMRHVSQIAVKERQTAIRNGWENDILLNYLKHLDTSFNALSMKHGFAAMSRQQHPHQLEIDVVDSGFPSAAEIRRLGLDADEAIAAKVEEIDLRPDMVDFILTRREAPHELRFQQAMNNYRRMLRQQDLFRLRMEPVIESTSDIQPGLRRCLVHWAVYDTKLNTPFVYIMVVDDSTRGPALADDADRLAAFRRSCLNYSMSSLKLLTIATEIDKEFKDLHPKSLKRIVVGPMYSSRFTEMNGAIAQTLAPFHGDHQTDWILNWTVETLSSKGSRKVKDGMFSDRVLEDYDVDARNHKSFETGTTEALTRAVMPYAVYQALTHLKDNPLGDIPKYVIAQSGHIAFHI